MRPVSSQPILRRKLRAPRASSTSVRVTAVVLLLLFVQVTLALLLLFVYMFTQTPLRKAPWWHRLLDEPYIFGWIWMGFNLLVAFVAAYPWWFYFYVIRPPARLAFRCARWLFLWLRYKLTGKPMHSVAPSFTAMPVKGSGFREERLGMANRRNSLEKS